MSTYPASDLLQQWIRGEITPEQAIGHLLQHLVALHQQYQQLASSVGQIDGNLNELANRVATRVDQPDAPALPPPGRSRRRKR